MTYLTGTDPLQIRGYTTGKRVLKNIEMRANNPPINPIELKENNLETRVAVNSWKETPFANNKEAIQYARNVANQILLGDKYKNHY